MPDPYVHVDVTAAQAGRPSVGVNLSSPARLTVAESLLLSDDLRRAALTAEQLHTEWGDDRDPDRAATAKAQAEQTSEEPF